MYMENYNDLEKFEGLHSRQENRITITKSYSVGLPTKFYLDNNIHQYKYSVLFWSKDRKIMGIHFTSNDNEKNKFSVGKNEKYGGSISARSFFKHYEIDPKLYFGKYDWEKIKKDGVGEIYVIQLTAKEGKNEQ